MGEARSVPVPDGSLYVETTGTGSPEDIEPPAADRLHEVRVPTLVLPADHDPPEMVRIGRILAEGIAGARVVQIPRTDHVVNMRRPEEFNRVALAFLGEMP